MRLLLVAVLVGALAGCTRGPKTPEQAFAGLETAIRADDAPALYHLLDQPTQWAIQSTLRDQRLMRTIIGAKYPEAEAKKALVRLQAATEKDPAQYFKRVDQERHILAGLRARLGPPGGPIQNKIDGPDAEWVARRPGQPFHFQKNQDRTWGFEGLRADWQREQERAVHDLGTVKENAKLYQKAGQP